MNCIARVKFLTLVIGLLITTAVHGQVAGGLEIGLNRIEGRVMDESNLGVNNAFVELYNNTGTLVARQRSSGQGRFSFRGMGPGRYTVAVKPYGTHLKEDSREIEINNQFSRSDTVIVDFRLQPDNRFRPEISGVVGTVFAQDVPREAERLYQAGVTQIHSDREKALSNLRSAVKLFPNYFNALAALGKAHVIFGSFSDGYPYLIRAIDINRRCADCYYSLALAFYKLDDLDAALKAINGAAILQAQAPPVRLLQGIILRLKDDLPAAEKSLLIARSLYKDPNPEVHWQLSLVYNRMGKNREAADELETYLKIANGLERDEKESVRNLIDKLRKAT